MDTIVVPVDGASNIKLEVLDFNTLITLMSESTETPVREVQGLKYNCTAEECAWFDTKIRELSRDLGTIRVIAPVARGASGGLVGQDNTFCEVPGGGLTLAYTQSYPDRVEERFRELAGSEEEFFLETGSIRDFPGSLTLIKRFLYEEMERPEVLNRSACFGTYGSLLSGHFLGDDYLSVVRTAGNEHSYWMCHAGARNIHEKPGTPSSLSAKISSFGKMVPGEPCLVYKGIGKMSPGQALSLGVSGELLVIPGGHDTCLSHIPIMSTYYYDFKDEAAASVIHVDGGSWTLVAQIGGSVDLPADGYKRDIIVQGTVDGQPVVTARYGGGHDFKYMKNLMKQRGCVFCEELDERLLEETVRAANCFILPNISPAGHKTGPFPNLRGRIINEQLLFENPERACILINLTTALTTAFQIEAISRDASYPVVITGGAAKDLYFGRLLATVTGRGVYALVDMEGHGLTETTTLGAAIVGKAASMGVHPYRVDMCSLGVTYRKLPPFGDEIKRLTDHYRERFTEEIEKALRDG
ncbi:hypothetical protein LLG96_09600 [bacterium]|nr:hypothetical protein [bacterium]